MSSAGYAGGLFVSGVPPPRAGRTPRYRVSAAVVRVHHVESPLALYRRYRPETFAEVIGQDHVTEPLRAALANNRVNHAYLFSGPRGCGKTTSARILARALNCEQAPVADPCGECDSCRDLARGGPGSIDVIEIDAASHGGVDDARDLREKAFFAPVRSRYKVYIIDEAHMVTTQGFNALLKLVEEPPPHLRFIFATTEPDKVLPTIRSRTHHYPFRLIPPRLLSSYLSELCGAGGRRDRARRRCRSSCAPAPGRPATRLSVLDQLLGGAGPAGVTHQLATGLLGYTPDTLLDEVVDAFAAGDGAAVFGVVDKVIETGQDPRRFTEDLLRRLRDLVIVDAVPDAPATGLIDCSEDQGERLVAQAARFGSAELSRAADLVATGLTEMRGATAPRLLLELVCARVLLPGADHATDGVLARLDRLEKRIAITGTPSATAAAAPSAPPAQDRPRASSSPASAEPPLDIDPAVRPVAAHRARGAGRRGRPPAPERRRGPAPETRAPAEPAVPAPGARPERPAARREPAAARSRPPAPAAPAGGLTLVDVRRLWPDIVEATKLRRRVTWMHLTQNCQVVARRGPGADARLLQRRRPRLLRQRRQRRDRAPGRDRRGRRRLADRDDRRPRRQGRPARAPRGRRPRRRRRPSSPASPAGRARPRPRPPRASPPRLGADEPADAGRTPAAPDAAAPRAGARRRGGRPGRHPADPPGRRRAGRAAAAPTPTPTPTPTTWTPTTRASTAPSCCAASSAPRSSTRSRHS